MITFPRIESLTHQIYVSHMSNLTDTSDLCKLAAILREHICECKAKHICLQQGQGQPGSYIKSSTDIQISQIYENSKMSL